MQSLSKAEIRALLTAARAARERDWLMILVTYLHGLRVSETVEITADDVQFDSLTVARKKGSERTVQKLIEHPDPLLNERAGLLLLVEKQPGKQRLFPVSDRHFRWLMKRYCARAGIPEAKAHPHALKHSRAMHMIDSAGIHRTQAWLGHKSMASTGKYLVPSDEEIFEAAEASLGDL